ncbi:MAG: hypothetical protein ACYSWO_21470 [Planctomycetota bacterium]|jgi:hypothetical protein
MKRAEQEHSESDVGEEEVPVCLRCIKPVDPANHYCPHCGEATGQLTHYIPFVNIPWQARIWGQMWRQIWSREVSVAGRLFRLFMIVWNVPIMLVGLIPVLWGIVKRAKNRQNVGPSRDTL